MGKDNSTPQTQLNFSEQLENFNNCLKTIHEEFNVVHSELSREQKKLELVSEVKVYKYLYTPNVRVEPIEFHIGFK